MGRDALRPLDEYLEEAILSFHPEIGDPADSDYQKGYLAALIEVRKYFNPEYKKLLDKSKN
jgi:hypothetical protein